MKLMVLVDDSSYSRAAFESAVQHKQPEDVLYVVHSSPTPASIDSEENETNEQMCTLIATHTKRVLDHYLAEVQDRKVENAFCMLLRGDEMRQVVVDFIAKSDIDTLYVGQRSVGTHKRWYCGSFSNFMLTHAPCTVVVIKKPGRTGIEPTPNADSPVVVELPVPGSGGSPRVVRKPGHE